MQVRCGSVSLERDAGGTFRVVLRETSSGDAAGGTAGTPFDTRCPPGMIMLGAQGRAGTRINRLGGRCAPLELSVR